jgi:hypothetical protein
MNSHLQETCKDMHLCRLKILELCGTVIKMNSGPDRIRTDDLLLRKQSHYPSYATSPKSFDDLRLIWIAIS